MKVLNFFKLPLLVLALALVGACSTDPTAADEIEEDEKTLEQRDQTGKEVWDEDESLGDDE